MKLKNKDLRKLLILCYEKRTPKEQDILLKYFIEVATITILTTEIVDMIKKLVDMIKKSKVQEKGG